MPALRGVPLRARRIDDPASVRLSRPYALAPRPKGTRRPGVATVRRGGHMAECGCTPVTPETAEQRRTLKLALALNAVMFVVETTSGIIGHSTGLIADGLDMLADAAAYAVALLAIGRSGVFKSNAAMASGILLLVLGCAVLLDVVRRAISGEPPEGLLMVVVASVALVVNATVLKLLGRYRDGEVHLRATWIFTRADLIANVAVIASGIAVLATEIRALDLIVGAGIGLYVIREAVEILADARASRAAEQGAAADPESP